MEGKLMEYLNLLILTISRLWNLYSLHKVIIFSSFIRFPLQRFI